MAVGKQEHQMPAEDIDKILMSTGVEIQEERVQTQAIHGNFATTDNETTGGL